MKMTSGSERFEINSGSSSSDESSCGESQMLHLDLEPTQEVESDSDSSLPDIFGKDAKKVRGIMLMMVILLPMEVTRLL